MYIRVYKDPSIVKISFRECDKDFAEYCVSNAEDIAQILTATKDWICDKFDGAVMYYVYSKYDDESKAVIRKINTTIKGYKRLDTITDTEVTVNVKPLEYGEYKIINFPSKGIVKSVRRNSKETNSRYGVCVSNRLNSEFLSDCVKGGVTFNTISKYKSRYLYDKWANILETEYARYLVKE